MGHSWAGSIGVHLAASFPDRVRGLVLLDGGHEDHPAEQSRDELAAQFEAEQAGFAFDSWEDWFRWVREQRVTSRRASLEPRYGEVAMHEVDGKIVPRASARVAAWARWGVHAEPPTSAHPHVRDLVEDAPHETARLVAAWLESALASAG